MPNPSNHTIAEIMSAHISFVRVAKISILLIALIGLLASSTADAKAKHKHHKARAGVDGTASYADIVIDAETGRILHSASPDSQRHPASLTKMMTLYIAFEALESGRLQLDQYLPVSANASEQSPSKLGLRRGQRVKVEDLVLGIVTESANDAAVVLAEALGGSEARFGQIMTQQARELGMNRTNFHNPSGLPDPQQVTTARDMAVLGHALIYHYPKFYSYFSTSSFTYSGVRHANHNHLMERYDGMDGIKTGYIRASGFNLVASVVRGNTRLIAVVFGGRSATSRDNQMAQLLDQAFIKAGEDRRRMVSGTNRSDYPQGDASDDERMEFVAFSGKNQRPPTKPAVVSAPRKDEGDGNDANPGGWGVQIGAYNDVDIGRQALAGVKQALPQLVGNTKPIVQEVSAGGVTLYRARLQGTDEKTARAVCAYLVRHGQSCLTVAPEIVIAR